MASIIDVARHANVSRSTVSRVINGEPYVRADVRARVLASARELDYVPLRTSASLRRGRSRTIGMIVPDIANPSQVAMVRGAYDAADGFGYVVMLGNTDEDAGRERQFIDEMIAERASGVLMIPLPDHGEHLARLTERGIKTVALARVTPDHDLDAVVADNVGSARAATEHLLDQGHRSIGIVSSVPRISPIAERYQGYFEAMHATGLEPSRHHVVEGTLAWGNDDADRVRSFLASADRPTALLVNNSQAAIVVLRVLRDLGITVPEISLVCLEDQDWCEVANPPLSAVEQPSYAMGARAMEVLLQRIEGSNEPCQIHRLETRLVIRESTAAPGDAHGSIQTQAPRRTKPRKGAA